MRQQNTMIVISKLTIERARLDDNLDALNYFVKTGGTDSKGRDNEVSDEQMELLKKQLEIMKSYRQVLSERINGLILENKIKAKKGIENLGL